MYQSYKPYLQNEFGRTCVYCRQPDSNVPYANFGVDHYRPKGLPAFAGLECDYTNLYYCCGNCNSRKNDDWPDDEVKGPYVVNPCDYEMAAHLRFDAKSGQVTSRTEHGLHTWDLLQLNDKNLIEYRLNTLATLDALRASVVREQEMVEVLRKQLDDYAITKDVFDVEVDVIEGRITRFNAAIQSHNGEKPLPPLPRQRNGLTLLKI
jgi:hypothetical protein